MKHHLRWDHLTWPQIEKAKEAGAIILLPMGSVEQHGPHLPVGCDHLLATAMAERIAGELDSRGVPALVAPTFMVANSVHHMRFSGTVTLQPHTFMQALGEQLDCMAAHGFKKIVIINGHGGNTAPLGAALVTINTRLGFPVYAMGYWQGAPHIQKQVLESQDGMIHACEAETSLMLALMGDLVDPCYTETKGPMAHPTAAENADSIGTFRRMEEMTQNGVMGNSYLATAQKGEALAAAMVTGAADVLMSGLWPA